MEIEFVLTIEETGRQNLKVPAESFNCIVEYFKTKEALKNYLIERYGKMPNGKKKVYIDTKKGKVIPIGFLHSYWNQDVSHNSKLWYQTDWITYFEKETIKTYFKL